jgi:hypothetical protein
LYESAGQLALEPSQTSAISHCESTEGRQTVPLFAIWHCVVQQSEFFGSQTAPERNLQVEASQQGSLVSLPGSHSSPLSTMPLLQLRSEMMLGLPEAPGVARQVVLSELERVVQMLPTEHGEKDETFCSDTGDMM